MVLTSRCLQAMPAKPCSVRRALLQCGVGFREPLGGGRKVGGFLCVCGRKTEDEEERAELGLHDGRFL